MTTQKTAGELQVGDRIVGNTNYYTVIAIRPSILTGRHRPVIDVKDADGKLMTIDTGANEKLQDHLFEVDRPA
jgi:hypothetical protein